MRNWILLFVITSLLISCQDDINEEKVKLQWVKNIDNDISEYDKNAIKKDSVIIDEYGETSILMFYKTDYSGILKYTSESSLSGIYPLKLEIYIKNENIIFFKFSGLSPKLYKRKRKEGESCCSLFESVTYYSSNKKAIKFTKGIDVMEPNEAQDLDLESLSFEEVNLKDMEKNYQNSLDVLNRFKNKLKEIK